MMRPPQQQPRLPFGVQDELADVRQSAFALVGDLAKSCAPQIAPIAPQLLQLAMHQLEPAAITQDSISACNNACWSLGAHPPTSSLFACVSHVFFMSFQPYQLEIS